MPALAGRLQIYNMALGFIGTRTIGSPNERTPEAIQCGLYWDTARRAALRDFPYGFSQRWVQLAEIPLPEVYGGEWQFAYGWPDKALKVHRVHSPGRESRLRRDPFTVHNNGSINVILSNVERAVAECTFDTEDISLWDELFVMAMARKLACLISTALLKNNPQKLQQLEQLYALAVPRADGQDASEGEERRRPDGWLAARGGWR